MLFQTIIIEREGLEDSNYLIKKDLITRAISSIVLVILALYLNHIGKYYFFSAVLLASVVLLFEYYKLFDAKTLHINFLISIFFGLISLIFIYFGFSFSFLYSIFTGILFSLYLSKKKYFFALIPYFYFYIHLGALLYLNSHNDGKLFIGFL